MAQANDSDDGYDAAYLSDDNISDMPPTQTNRNEKSMETVTITQNPYYSGGIELEELTETSHLTNEPFEKIKVVDNLYYE